MQNILNQIQANIEIVTAIVISLAGLAILVINKYKEIKDAINATINAGKNKAKLEAINATLPLIAKAKSDAIGLAHELVLKEALPTEQTVAAYVLNDPEESRKNIVAQALIERNPKTLKKLKLKDILQVGNFVSDVYQMVKPIIKAGK